MLDDQCLSTDGRASGEDVYAFARRLAGQVDRLRFDLKIEEEKVARQLREIERLRGELRREGLSERVVVGPGIVVGPEHEGRYAPRMARQPRAEAAQAD